jgi:hypothetical protein
MVPSVDDSDSMGEQVIKHVQAKVALAGVAAVLGVVGFVGSAQAANPAMSRVLNSSGTELGYGYSHGAQGAVEACDTHSDGLGVTVYYFRQDGKESHITDNNGANAACASTANNEDDPITEFWANVGQYNGPKVTTQWAG